MHYQMNEEAYVPSHISIPLKDEIKFQAQNATSASTLFQSPFPPPLQQTYQSCMTNN